MVQVEEVEVQVEEVQVVRVIFSGDAVRGEHTGVVRSVVEAFHGSVFAYGQVRAFVHLLLYYPLGIEYCAFLLYIVWMVGFCAFFSLYEVSGGGIPIVC